MGSLSPLARLFTLILARARIALTYHEIDSPLNKAPAGLKMASLAIAWIGLVATGLPHSLPILAWVAMLSVIAPRSLLPSAFGLSLIPTTFIGIASLILSPYQPLTQEWMLRALTLATRTMGLSMASLLIFATTSPLELASLLAKWPRAHDLIIIFYRSLPLTVGDVAEALVAQQSIGKPLHHILVPTTLMALRRAESLSLSLYTRGYKIGPRTRIVFKKRVGIGIFLVLTAFLLLTFSLILENTA